MMDSLRLSIEKKKTTRWNHFNKKIYHFKINHNLYFSESEYILLILVKNIIARVLTHFIRIIFPRSILGRFHYIIIIKL